MKTHRSIYVAVGAIAAAVVGGFYWLQGPTEAESQDYKPVIDPANFISEIDNKFS